MLIWVVVVLVGILAHELGHAFAGRRLGLEPWIQLMAFGGMTGWMRPRPLTSGQRILISAAGPAVGISIGGAVLIASFAGVFAGASPAVMRVLDFVLWVNLGWGVLNLLPILPLDGEVTAVAFSPDARFVATGSQKGTARVWDAATGRPVGKVLAHSEPVRCIAVRCDGATVATGAGTLARLLGRLDEAIALGRRALKLDPLNSKTCNNLAIGLYCAGRLRESQALYERALLLNPRNPNPHVGGTLANASGGGSPGPPFRFRSESPVSFCEDSSRCIATCFRRRVHSHLLA